MSNKVRAAEVVIHLVIWALLATLLIEFQPPFMSGSQALERALIRLGLLVFVAYANLLVLIPKLFVQGKMLQYGIAVLALGLLAVGTFGLLTRHHFVDFPIIPESDAFPRGRRPRPWAFHFLPTIFYTIVVFCVSTVVGVGRNIVKQEWRTTQLEKAKATHELNFLRSQINPHFLFNALNNIHASIQLRPGKAGEYVLKLADMLRYVLEDCQQSQVSLGQEIRYLKSYLYLEEARDAMRYNIDLQISGEQADAFMIEPMLFNPLVENAFKHAHNDNGQQIDISIIIRWTPGQLYFDIRNSVNTTEARDVSSHGIGLQNVSRRLQLLYPDGHKFDHGYRIGEFFATLEIDNP